MPESPAESSRQKIRSLCRELADRHQLDDQTCDELCGHLEDKLIAYLSGEERITEADALHLVRAHFGDAAQIARSLRREHSPAPALLSSRIDHTRLYTVALILLGVSTALSIPLGLVIWSTRQFQGSPSTTRLPDWAMPWWAAICLGYLIAIGVTLWCRRFRPAVGRSLTRMLNYLLLAAPPFGTLLGIYGLLKLDKEPEGQIA